MLPSDQDLDRPAAKRPGGLKDSAVRSATGGCNRRVIAASRAAGISAPPGGGEGDLFVARVAGKTRDMG
jgi:hypothetical protein